MAKGCVDLVVIVKRAPGDSKLESVVTEFLAARPQIERRVRSLLGAVPDKAASQA